MFGWFASGPPTGFDESLISDHVTLSREGARAFHSNDDDMGGVLFLNAPLQPVDGLVYFEVKLEVVRDDEEDGITIGVTQILPPSGTGLGCADDVGYSWSVGFDGQAHIHGAPELIHIPWSPRDLQRGDLVGFLISADGAASVLVNKEVVVTMPGILPSPLPVLYGMVDLLGNCQGVLLIENAQPPENMKDFNLAFLREDVVEEMYSALGEHQHAKVKEMIELARALGVSEKQLKGAERTVLEHQKKETRKGGEHRNKRTSARKSNLESGDPIVHARPSGQDDPASIVAQQHSSSQQPCVSPRPPATQKAASSEQSSSKAASNKNTDSAGQSLLQASERSLAQSAPGMSILADSGDVAPASPPQGGQERDAATAEVDKQEAAAADASTARDEAAAAAAAAKAEAAKAADASKAKADAAAAASKAAVDKARMALAEAVAGKSVSSIRQALRDAQAAGVDNAEMKRSEDALDDLEADIAKNDVVQAEKNAAVAAMDAAVKTKDVDSIKKSIDAARGKGVDISEISHIEQALKNLEAQLAFEAMDAALKTKDVGRIKSSIDAARGKGVDNSKISLFEQGLKDLEAHLAQQAMLKSRVKDMEDALPSKDVGKIRSAIKAAEDAGVDSKAIAAAQASLETIEIKIKLKGLVAKMDEAAQAEDVDQVKDAISKAKDAGVDSSEIARCEASLLKLEEEFARKEMEKELLVSLKSNDVATINASLIKAKDMKVDSGVVEKAEKYVEELLRKIEEARQKLQEAMTTAKKIKPPTIDMLDDLDVATKAAAASGIPTKEAEALHVEMTHELAEAKKVAEQELQAAVPGRDAQKVRACMVMCKRFRSDDAILVALDEVAKTIAADILIAKGVDKEQKSEMMGVLQAYLEILREHLHPQLKKLHNDIVDLKGALRVFCRIRPLNRRELDMNDTIAVDAKDQFTVTVNRDVAQEKRGKDNIETFGYDSIFIATNSQEDVFEECKSLIQSSFDGYNVTIFTYGQTGAGKTWTLYGIPEQPGVSPRTCDEVMDIVTRDSDKYDFVLNASMVELYNSNVRDLLSREKTPPKLDIHNEKTAEGTLRVVLACHQVPINSAEDLEKAVSRGFGQRKTASTGMNADSSRSHLMFMIWVKVKEKATGKERIGKITIVDLAGSERLAKSQVTGDAQKEAIEINKSLTALGDVMMAITQKAKMIPYRNHKLTQLMQDSLGGTAKTLMFVNISPASNNADETINALKYASRARSIENDTTQNGAAPKMRGKAVAKAKSDPGRSRK